MRPLRPLLPAVAFVFALVLSAAAAGAAPIEVTAAYEETQHGEHTMSKIVADGKSRFPNGTRLAVGLRQRGEAAYILWYNAIVKEQQFHVDMGPFRKPLAAGSYMVEAWFDPMRQPATILDQIKNLAKSDSTLDSGRDQDGNLIVMGRVEVGTKEMARKDQDDSRAFYLGLGKELKLLLEDVQGRSAKHELPDKERPADATPEAWRGQAASWTEKFNNIDHRALDFNGARTTISYPSAYKHLSGAVLAGHDLIAAFGERIDPANYGFPSRDAAKILETGRKALADLEEAVKPRSSDEDIPARPKKKGRK